MDVDEEKRRFQRLRVTLPVEYTLFHPETGETHQGQGVLQDFSLSGVYFYSLASHPLQPGHVLTLTIATPLPPLSHFDPTQIQARGEVVRLDEDTEGNAGAGIAVTFLEFPTFFLPANHVNFNGC